MKKGRETFQVGLFARARSLRVNLQAVIVQLHLCAFSKQMYPCKVMRMLGMPLAFAFASAFQCTRVYSIEYYNGFSCWLAVVIAYEKCSTF